MISNVDQSDSDTYVCRAVNEVGSSEARVKIEVKGGLACLHGLFKRFSGRFFGRFLESFLDGFMDGFLECFLDGFLDGLKKLF